jgi:hypothetical protein
MKIEAEKKRRLIQERLRKYQPQKPPDGNDQYGFHYSVADERWIFGGNRSGKTEAGVVDAIWFAIGKHPVRSITRKPPVKIRHTAPKWREGIVGNILRKYKEMVPREHLRGSSWSDAWSEKDHTLYYADQIGTFVNFKSNEEDLDTFGGVDLDMIHQDEHTPEPYYRENRARLTDRNGFLIATMTPELGVTWEEDHVLMPPDGLSVDHWFFDPEGVKKFIASIRDESVLDVKIHGQFIPLTGRVIPQWNPNVHVIPDRPLHPDAHRVFCIDCHLKTPSAAMWAAWEPDELFGTRLIIYRTAKKAYTVPEWKDFIRTKSAGEVINAWIGDETERESTGKNVYGKESIISEFNKEPDRLPIVQVEKGKGSFDAGIWKLREWFGVDPVNHRCRIYVFESCRQSAEIINGKPAYSFPDEIRRYSFKKEQAADEESLRESVRKVNDHYCDDVRYIVQRGPVSVRKSSGSKVVLPPGARRSEITGVVR